jgi:drug/metabolite transporter (DMT)-like permease
VFHAIGLVLNKQAFQSLEDWNGMRGMPAALHAGFARMGSAALALALLGLVTGSIRRQTVVFREPAGWRATFLPAFFGAFVAMFTMQVSLTLLKSGVASVLLAMTSIFTIPVEWRVLGRRPSARGVAGAFIALLGVVLLVSGR